MLSNFDKYYDLIFSQKKYKKEVLYILKNARTTRPKKILDVGCGTGTHSDLIYGVRKTKIIALDTNKSAIKIAKKKNKNIYFSNKKLKLINENNFDLIISMFNVVNYFKDMKQLIIFFKDIKQKLSKKSIFIFDAWNGSFTFNNTIVREKRIIESKDFILKNYIKSIKKDSSRKIHLNYAINILLFKNNKKISINHKLTQYLWTPKEIMYALITAGFKSIRVKKSFTNQLYSKKDLKIIFLVS